MVAMLFSPAVFSADAAPDAMDNSFQVLGESLDSGLGDLSPSYTAAEFQRYRVAGESLDSGLGDLSPSYTAPNSNATELPVNRWTAAWAICRRATQLRNSKKSSS